MKRLYCSFFLIALFFSVLSQAMPVYSGDTSVIQLPQADTTRVFASRYFFASSAVPFKKGESFANYSLFGPDVQWALADNFSVGIWGSWFLMPFAANFKYIIPGEGVHVGVGGMVGSTTYSFPHTLFSMPYLMLSMGNHESNFTINAGAITTHFRRETYNPFIGGMEKFGVNTIGFQMSAAFSAKVGMYTHLIVEMLYVPSYNIKDYEYEPISDQFFNTTWRKREYITASNSLFAIGPGIRVQKRPRLAYQIGLSILAGFDGMVIPVPLFSVMKKIGKE